MGLPKTARNSVSPSSRSLLTINSSTQVCVGPLVKWVFQKAAAARLSAAHRLENSPSMARYVLQHNHGSSWWKMGCSLVLHNPHMPYLPVPARPAAENRLNARFQTPHAVFRKALCCFNAGAQA